MREGYAYTPCLRMVFTQEEGGSVPRKRGTIERACLGSCSSLCASNTLETFFRHLFFEKTSLPYHGAFLFVKRRFFWLQGVCKVGVRGRPHPLTPSPSADGEGETSPAPAGFVARRPSRRGFNRQRSDFESALLLAPGHLQSQKAGGLNRPRPAFFIASDILTVITCASLPIV